jgi:hypothetical protein
MEKHLNEGRLLLDLTNRRNQAATAAEEAEADLQAFCVAQTYVSNKRSGVVGRVLVNPQELPAKARQWITRLEKGSGEIYCGSQVNQPHL